MSIITEDEEASVIPTKTLPVFFVEQVNDKPLIRQSSFGRVVGSKVAAFVPACSPTAASIVPEKDFNALASCYANTITAAVGAGAKTVVVRQLGVAKKVNKVIGQGDSADIEVIGEMSKGTYKLVEAAGAVVGHDTWGDMFWTVARTALAAKRAVMASDQKFPGGEIEVVFVVPKEAYAEWDATMSF